MSRFSCLPHPQHPDSPKERCWVKSTSLITWHNLFHITEDFLISTTASRVFLVTRWDALKVRIYFVSVVCFLVWGNTGWCSGVTASSALRSNNWKVQGTIWVVRDQKQKWSASCKTSTLPIVLSLWPKSMKCLLKPIGLIFIWIHFVLIMENSSFYYSSFILFYFVNVLDHTSRTWSLGRGHMVPGMKPEFLARKVSVLTLWTICPAYVSFSHRLFLYKSVLFFSPILLIPL